MKPGRLLNDRGIGNPAARVREFPPKSSSVPMLNQSRGCNDPIAVPGARMLSPLDKRVRFEFDGRRASGALSPPPPFVSSGENAMRMRIVATFLLVVGTWVTVPAVAQETLTYVDLVQRMIDLE